LQAFYDDLKRVSLGERKRERERERNATRERSQVRKLKKVEWKHLMWSPPWQPPQLLRGAAIGGWKRSSRSTERRHNHWRTVHNLVFYTFARVRLWENARKEKETECVCGCVEDDRHITFGDKGDRMSTTTADRA